MSSGKGGVRTASRIAGSAVLIAAQLAAAPLAQEITRLLDASPAARTALWGIEISDIASGKILYAQNARRFFVPASNTKLFTTALALARLGPGFRFQTRVFSDTQPDEAGRVAGALRLVGGGDPNLSGRAVPYRMGATHGNPLAAIEELADQVVARGIRHVDGGIVGDDSWYTWEPYAKGWAIEDAESDDGPPVSALTINDNSLTITVRPGVRAGELAEVSLDPPLEYYEIDNRVLTTGVGGQRKIQWDREPGSRQVRIWGGMPLRDRGEEVALAIDDPPEYAARAFRRALEDRGVKVEGAIEVRHRFPNEDPLLFEQAGAELARHDSAALLQDLRITSKVSQNLHAELVLRAVAMARQKVGSREAGLAEMKAFLTEIGIEPDTYHFGDASGLARLNLVTPDALIKLLGYMYGSPQQKDWISLLPVGGVDGTLSARFGNGPALGRVYAKTGSLAHVSALSGYGQRIDGRWVAFSILVNNYNGPSAEIRGVIDRICTLIVE